MYPKLFLTSLLICLGAVKSYPQTKLRTITNHAFRANEVLEYRVHYGFIDAGEAKLEIESSLKPMGPRMCYHVVGTGKTRGAFDWFFKVRDRYESYIDTEAIIPWLFVRRVDEGGYHINQNVSFNQVQDSAKSEKKTICVPENVQDLISSYYYARTIDFSKAKSGDTYSFNGYLDDEVIPMSIRYVGKERISTGLGTFNCLKFHPQLLEGRVFKEKNDMTIWISDDDFKVVIRAEAEILVGSVKMDLQKYSGLAGTLAEVK